MRKVLIITYYWPPSGGSGVQRWLKFVKYFRDFGVEPIVYTPENSEIMVTDTTLSSEIPDKVEVLKRKIFEPYSMYKIFIGKSRAEKIKPGFISDSHKPSWKERLALFIRSNIFIPDPKCFWIRPSVKLLSKYISDNKIDVIISTAPPYSMHLIARRLSRRMGVKWIADFRDPWTDMYNFNSMKYSGIVKKIHRVLEKKVVRQADAVVVVTETMRQNFRKLDHKKIYLITNGYDSSDFLEYNGERGDSLFSITYTGLFLKMQNPGVLWKILGQKSSADPNFKRDLKINLIGNIDPSITQSIIEAGLSDNLVPVEYVPHSEVIKLQKETQILLLSGGDSEEAKGILTGKCFEYLASRRAILAFCRHGSDIEYLLQDCGISSIFDYGESEPLAEWIDQRYSEFRDNGGISGTTADIERFSRRGLTKDMVSVIDDIIC